MKPARKLLALTVAICTSVTLSSCSSTQQDVQQTTAAPEKLNVDPIKVSLLDAGTGELTQLKYQPTAAQQQVNVELASGFNQSATTKPALTAPHDANVYSFSMPLTATSSTEGDDFQVKWVLGSPTYSDLTYADDAASANGFAVEISQTATGKPTAVGLTAPEAATENGRRLAEQYLMQLLSLPVAFPDEAVGPGARWTVDNRVTGNGSMLQTTTYTLLSRVGNRLELKVEVAQRPSQTVITDPTNNQSLSVEHVDTQSEGLLSVDLTAPLPVAGKLTFANRIIYGAAGSDVKIAQDNTNSFAFTTTPS